MLRHLIVEVLSVVLHIRQTKTVTRTVCLLAAAARKFLIPCMTDDIKRVLLIRCVYFCNDFCPSQIGLCGLWNLLPQRSHSYYSTISYGHSSYMRCLLNHYSIDMRDSISLMREQVNVLTSSIDFLKKSVDRLQDEVDE
jgi:hypothetical protein